MLRMRPIYEIFMQFYIFYLSARLIYRLMKLRTPKWVETNELISYSSVGERWFYGYSSGSSKRIVDGLQAESIDYVPHIKRNSLYVIKS